MSIIPLKRESAVVGAGPVGGDVVVSLESVEKMISIGFIKVFDCEIINAEAEGGTSRGVLPQTGG